MELRLAKMHGAANDFVVLDQAPPPAPRDGAVSAELCDRRRGVGADGALWMERLADDPVGAVFRMHFYNGDGSRARMCFNGARCCALRAVDLGWADPEHSFHTDYGLLQARVDPGRVTLRFPPPEASRGTVDLPAGAPSVRGYPVVTGDPHLVIDLEEAVFASLDFEAAARPLRWWNDVLPEGANVHMVHRAPDAWRIRSFERGVEGETWACGSGCIATVLALGGEPGRAVTLRTHGGDRIEVEPGTASWRLTGPAVKVFETVVRVEEHRVRI
jgi:diaminopimelate epimerase